MKRGYAWLVLTSFVALSLLIGCAGQAPAPAKPTEAPKQAQPTAAPKATEAAAPKAAPAKDLGVVRLADFPVSDNLIYYVIRDKGFDREFGIKIEGERFQAGPSVNEAMLAGAIDVAYQGTIPLMIVADRGQVPGKMIGVGAATYTNPQHPLQGLVVNKSINSFKDLEGKKVAINQRKSLLHLTLVERLRREGVKLDAVEFVEIPPPNMEAALGRGDIAGMSLTEPFVTASVSRGSGKLLDWIAGKPPFDNFQITFITFTKGFYDKNPQAVKALLKAQMKAADWINKNPDDARQILAKEQNIDAQVMKQMSLLYFPPDQRVNPASLEATMKILVDAKVVEKSLPVNQLYDEKLLDEATKEMGNR